MTSSLKVRVRKTPNCLHKYTATVKGHAAYGWGNTPAEARAKLAKNLTKETKMENQKASATTAQDVTAELKRLHEHFHRQYLDRMGEGVASLSKRYGIPLDTLNKRLAEIRDARPAS